MTEVKDITANEMFGSDNGALQDQIREMAEPIAIEIDTLDKLSKELIQRKEVLDAAKEQLCRVLQEAGMESCKLESGLSPKAKVNRKYFKVADIEDTVLHAWLREVELGDIVKPYVHFQTMQAALRAYEEQGGEIPEKIVTISLQPTVTMYGKSKFLKAREEGENG